MCKKSFVPCVGELRSLGKYFLILRRLLIQNLGWSMKQSFHESPNTTSCFGK